MSGRELPCFFSLVFLRKLNTGHEVPSPHGVRKGTVACATLYMYLHGPWAISASSTARTKQLIKSHCYHAYYNPDVFAYPPRWKDLVPFQHNSPYFHINADIDFTAATHSFILAVNKTFQVPRKRTKHQISLP